MTVLESFNLTGKVALVTGGGGLYGRQITQGLAEAGAKTIIASRDLVKLQSRAAAFAAGGLDVDAMQLDQASEASVTQLLQEIIHLRGRLDILVNNAVERTMSDWHSPAEAFERMGGPTWAHTKAWVYGASGNGLFAPASAVLSPEGKEQIARVAGAYPQRTDPPVTLPGDHADPTCADVRSDDERTSRASNR